MNLNQLRYFIEVVDTNSITKAAKNLYISQPAISKAISEATHINFIQEEDNALLKYIVLLIIG